MQTTESRPLARSRGLSASPNNLTSRVFILFDLMAYVRTAHRLDSPINEVRDLAIGAYNIATILGDCTMP